MKKTLKPLKRVLARELAVEELTVVRGSTGEVIEAGDVVVTQGEVRRDITQVSAGDIPEI